MRKLKRVVIKEELVELTGDFRSAIILNQLIYWSERVKDFDKFIEEENERIEEVSKKLELRNGWIYKKAEELAEELMVGFTKPTMRKYLDILVHNGWIDERNNPILKWDKTKQYRVNIIKIQKDLIKLGYSLDNYPLEALKLPKLKNFTSELKNFTSEENNFTSEQNNFTAIPETTTDSLLKEINKEKINDSCITDESRDSKALQGNQKDVKVIAVEIMTYLNKKTGKHFRTNIIATPFLKIINARLTEGYELEDFKTIIDNKLYWIGTEQEKYLTPTTLFCMKHFENYLNEKPRKVKVKATPKTQTGLSMEQIEAQMENERKRILDGEQY